MGAPLTKEDFLKRHQADLQAAGFDIQFTAFVDYLFDLKGGDVITYEGDDDIEVSCSDGTTWLIQVKSSVDDDTRITDSDTGLWNTFGTWLSLYEFARSKDDFLKQGNKFILYTNKIVANKFCDIIEQLKNGECGIEDIQKFLKSFLNKINETAAYYDTVKKLTKLNEISLRKLLLKFEVHYVSDTLGHLYDRFLAIYNKPTKADQILSEILGKMLREKIMDAKGRVHLSFEKNAFMEEYRGILQKVYDESLEPLEEDLSEIPSNIMDSPFMKHLEKIHVLDFEGSKEIYYGYWLCYGKSIQYYYSVQLMTPELEKKLNKTAVNIWYTSFRKAIINIRPSSSEEDKEGAAQNCFFDVIGKGIPIDDVHTLRMPFSSGWYLNLTNDIDSPTICWHIDVYKNKKDKQ